LGFQKRFNVSLEAKYFSDMQTCNLSSVNWKYSRFVYWRSYNVYSLSLSLHFSRSDSSENSIWVQILYNRPAIEHNGHRTSASA